MRSLKFVSTVFCFIGLTPIAHGHSGILEKGPAPLYKLVLFANSVELKQRLARLGVSTVSPHNVVAREYTTNDPLNICQVF